MNTGHLYGREIPVQKILEDVLKKVPNTKYLFRGNESTTNIFWHNSHYKGIFAVIWHKNTAIKVRDC